jgi:hypothetical protein
MNHGLRKLAALGEFVDRDTMRFVRDYPHPVQRVWDALVTPEQMSVWWMPCEMLEAREGGRYVLRSPIGNATFKGRIKEFRPPNLIDFSGVTRFELFEHEGGCRLVLTLKRWPNGWNPVSLAGFHGWLEQLRLHLAGHRKEEIDKLVTLWPWVFPAYEYLISLNVADGAKVIHRVHFESGSATLRDSTKPVLDEVVALLREKPDLRIQADGFCDDPYPIDESLKLASARAEAVSKYLRDAGVSPERTMISAAGNSHQIVPSDSEEGRAFNRRVELRPIY